MCLAIPGKIISIKKQNATVDFRGIKKEVDISLVNAKQGDYVVVHAGFAVGKLDKKSANESYKYFDEYIKTKHGKNT